MGSDQEGPDLKLPVPTTGQLHGQVPAQLLLLSRQSSCQEI